MIDTNLIRDAIMALDLGLRGRPVYPILASELPVHVRSVGAFTLPNLCWSLRPYIGSRWAGPGPCWVLCDQGQTDPTVGMAHSLHELGHCLTHVPICSDTPPADTPDAGALLPLLARLDRSPPLPSTKSIPWLQHEAGWIRASLHLWHRANARGHAVPLEMVCSTRSYGLASGTEAYLDDLAGELAAEEPLLELLQRPLPRSFQERWQAESMACLPYTAGESGVRWQDVEWFNGGMLLPRRKGSSKPANPDRTPNRVLVAEMPMAPAPSPWPALVCACCGFGIGPMH